VDPERQQEEATYDFIRTWGKMLLVVASWPVLFLVVFFMYLQFPIIALILFAVLFLVWVRVLTLPGVLRSNFGGKRNRH